MVVERSDSDSLDVFFLDEEAAAVLRPAPRRRRVTVQAHDEGEGLGSDEEDENGGSTSSSGTTDSSSNSSSRSSFPGTRLRSRRSRLNGRRRGRHNRTTKRGRLTAAILEETDERQAAFEHGDSYNGGGTGLFGSSRRHGRTSSASPPPSGRTKDPIAPGLYTRVRKRSATPMDFEALQEWAGGLSGAATSEADSGVEWGAGDTGLRRQRTTSISAEPPTDTIAAQGDASSIGTVESQSPTGLPIIQEFILDSQFSIMVEGRRHSGRLTVLYWILVIASGGLLWLVSRWFPIVRAKMTTRQTSLATSTHVLVTNSFKQRELIPVRRTYYGSLLSDVFGRQVVHECIVQENSSIDEEPKEEEVEEEEEPKEALVELQEILVVDENDPFNLRSLPPVEANEDIAALRQLNFETDRENSDHPILEQDHLHETGPDQNNIHSRGKYHKFDRALIEDLDARSWCDRSDEEEPSESEEERITNLESESEYGEELVYTTHAADAYPTPVGHVEVRDTASIASSFLTLHELPSEAGGPEPDDYLYWFEYRCLRFLYHPNTGRYFENAQWDTLHGLPAERLYDGLSSAVAAQRRVIFEDNSMRVVARSLWTLFIDEVFHPLNVFQLASIILWCFENYHLYATAIFAMSAAASAMTIYETHSNMHTVNRLATQRGRVPVFRDGCWLHRPVADLVPGDIFEVTLGDFSTIEDPKEHAENFKENLEEKLQSDTDSDGDSADELYADIVPCDALLLGGGDCIVNESMLTGESMPVSKVAMLPEHWDDLALGEGSAPILSALTRYYEKSVLYAGTRLIRVRREIPQDQEEQHILLKKEREEREIKRENEKLANKERIFCKEYGNDKNIEEKRLNDENSIDDQKCDLSNTDFQENPEDDDESSCRVTFALPGDTYRVKAIVLRTGFNTTKGNLIRTILFPRPTQFKFYRDSIRFVGILGGVAMLGFTYSILQLVILGQSLFHIITKACDMITIVVPPALPASMSVGANFSLLRLKQKRIYCISPSRINVAGKVNLVCFDKTGTLTEDTLDLLGIHTVCDAQSEPFNASNLSEDKIQISSADGIQMPLVDDLPSCVLSFPESEASDETTPPVASSGLSVGPLLYAIPAEPSLGSVNNDYNNLLLLFERQRAKQRLCPASDTDYGTLMFMAMGSCHTLKRVQEELVGDPLDMKMFRLTGLYLEEGVLFNGGTQATLSINRPPIAKSAAEETLIMPVMSKVPLTDQNYLSPISRSVETKVPLKVETGQLLPPNSVLPSASSAKTVHASSVLIKFGKQGGLGGGGGECLRILKAFEFYPELRRQSVVVKHYGARVIWKPDMVSGMKKEATCSENQDEFEKAEEASRLFVFVKGSPEELKELCVAVPDNYDALLDYYTFRGYRVLAVAFKRLKSGDSYEQRQKVERDLFFLGFLVFENRLKSATIPSLKILKEQARLRTLMCTGDNILTAISVAKECGMVASEATVFVPFLVKPELEYKQREQKSSDNCLFKASKDENAQNGKQFNKNIINDRMDDEKISVASSSSHAHGELYIRWCSTLDAHHVLSCTSLTPIYKNTTDIDEIVDEFADGKIDQSITQPSNQSHNQSLDHPIDQLGDSHGVTDHNSNYNSCYKDQLPFPQGQPYTLACTGRVLEYLIDCCDVSVLHRVLLTCSIYARLSPSQKQRLVECLQRLDYVVAFCGDGANDCGALKASDIGVSLSEAEASVAAPFTCARPDISCMLDLLREGRSSLVTSFSVFKYMALYSLIQFNSVLLLYHFGSNLGDAQFAYVDLVIIIPLAVAMNRLEATSTNLHYATPTASLVSRRHLASLLTQLLICLVFQYILVGALLTRPWYAPIAFSPASDNIPWHLNTVLFSFSAFQYVLVALVFTNNAPHQRPIYTNIPFMAIASLVSAWNFLFLIYPTPTIAYFMELVPLPLSFRLFILFCIALHTALSLWADQGALYLFKRVLSLAPSFRFIHQSTQPRPSKKLYKKLLADIHPDPLRV